MYLIILCLFIEWIVNQIWSMNAFSDERKHKFILHCGFSCVFSRVPYRYVATQMPQNY